jgi:hypothetical protein
MECKGCKRFATTTEAEIVEKRLKLNAERTIKQNKATQHDSYNICTLAENITFICTSIYL